MEFFKSFGKKRQSKAVTPLAIPTAAGSGQQQKAKDNDTVPSQQQTPNRQHNGSDSPGLTGPSFRQVCWGSDSPSYQASSFEAARGGESPFGTPFDKRRGDLSTTNSNSVIEPPEFNLSVARGPGLGIHQKNCYGPLGYHDSDSRHHCSWTPLKSSSSNNNKNNMGAIYVSPKRERQEISPSAADEAIERHSFAEDGEEIRLTRDPPKSIFLGNNMKRWETLLAQQTAAALSEMAGEEEEEEEEQHREDIRGEGEPSGIGNRANEEAVEAVRRLGRGEFQAVFSDFERAHTRSATQQFQRRRTRPPNTDEDSDQSEASRVSKHRSRSI
ncbi:hypothetical protein PG997_006270 [Apiospora hydei]|uniref:Uncharacterized protein n=1 Tax=Apiospora hydei TaxID=1337664 RepID=A0ABR1WN78_9PEZI